MIFSKGQAIFAEKITLLFGFWCLSRTLFVQFSEHLDLRTIPPLIIVSALDWENNIAFINFQNDFFTF